MLRTDEFGRSALGGGISSAIARDIGQASEMTPTRGC